MTHHLPPRSRAQRLADATARLQKDVDAWVASADETGEAYLVPLSFLWDGSRLLISTATHSRTARNLLRSKRTRIALGDVRDVVTIDVDVVPVGEGEPDDATGDAFASKAGFDPRTLTTPYTYFWLTPRRIQAWREEDELAGRELMRDGVWVQGPGGAVNLGW